MNYTPAIFGLVTVATRAVSWRNKLARDAASVLLIVWVLFVACAYAFGTDASNTFGLIINVPAGLWCLWQWQRHPQNSTWLLVLFLLFGLQNACHLDADGQISNLRNYMPESPGLDVAVWRVNTTLWYQLGVSNAAELLVVLIGPNLNEDLRLANGAIRDWPRRVSGSLRRRAGQPARISAEDLRS